MRKHALITLALASLLPPVTLTAQSVTLYRHTFDGPGNPIHGSAVDSGTLTPETWFAPSRIDGDDDNNRWLDDGNLLGGGFTSMLLPFTPRDGFEYRLEANLTRPTAEADGWISLGFYNTMADDGAPNSSNSGIAWLLYSANRNNDFAAHYNAAGGPGQVATTGDVSSNATDDLLLVLDTTGGSGNWTVTYCYNGTEFHTQRIARSTESTFKGIGIGMFGHLPTEPTKANTLKLTRSAESG